MILYLGFCLFSTYIPIYIILMDTKCTEDVPDEVFPLSSCEVKAWKRLN